MKSLHRLRLLLLAGALTLGMLLLGLHVIQAAMLHVSSLTDTTANDGYCTLREALINTNDDAATWPDCAAGNGADTIYLTNLSGQIILLSDLPPVTDADGLTLQGPGATLLTLNGNGLWRLLNAQSGVPIVVRNLTLARAGGTFGSAISVENASLELWSSAVLSSTNTAISVNGGRLTVVDSRFSGNTTTGAGGGYPRRQCANHAGGHF